MKVYKVHFSCWKVDSKGLKSEENFWSFLGKKILQVSIKNIHSCLFDLKLLLALNLSLDF